MGILIAFIVGSLAIFGASNAAKRDLIREDETRFDSVALSAPLEVKKEAIRVYFVELSQYQNIESIPQMSEGQINALYTQALLSFKNK